MAEGRPWAGSQNPEPCHTVCGRQGNLLELPSGALMLQDAQAQDTCGMRVTVHKDNGYIHDHWPVHASRTPEHQSRQDQLQISRHHTLSQEQGKMRASEQKLARKAALPMFKGCISFPSCPDPSVGRQKGSKKSWKRKLTLITIFEF